MALHRVQDSESAIAQALERSADRLAQVLG
jgi:hypothetical protein